MNTSHQVYFDYAASTPIDPEIKDYFVNLIDASWTNPNATHTYGNRSRSLLENARQNIATTLHCLPAEVFFLNSATEANNLVLQSYAQVGQAIVSGLEHESVKKFVVKNNGVIIPPEESGLVDVDKIIDAIKPNTSLISLMWVNNELGTIQKISELARKLQKINEVRKEEGLSIVRFHSDAVQAPNYLKINIQDIGIDLLTLSSQKVYAPRGSSILFKKTGTPISPLIHGGGQESGLWPGTQNVLAASAFSKALEKSQRLGNVDRIKHIQNQIISFAKKKNIKVNGDLNQRIPGNIHLSFKNIHQEELLTFMDLQGIAVSSGSSCASGSNTMSEVMQYLNLPAEYTAHLRITFGRFTSEQDVNILIQSLKSSLKLAT